MEFGIPALVSFVTMAKPLSPEFQNVEGGQDAMAILLLVLLLKILALGGIFFFMAIQVMRQRKRNTQRPAIHDSWYDSLHADKPDTSPSTQLFHLKPPLAWISIHLSKLHEVEKAFGHSNISQTEWDEFLSSADDEKLFIAPPIQGWTMIFGKPLEYMLEDTDKLFHLIRNLSSHFGTVQYFSVNPSTGAHGWVNSHQGKILRAYAWDESTLWNEGIVTRAERQLNLTTLDYLEPLPELSTYSFAPIHPLITKNVDKIYQLSGIWSLNPMEQNWADKL